MMKCFASDQKESAATENKLLIKTEFFMRLELLITLAKIADILFVIVLSADGVWPQSPVSPCRNFSTKKDNKIALFEVHFKKCNKKRGSHALRRATLISSFVRRKLSVDAHTCVWPRHPRLAAIRFLSIALSPEPQFSFWFCGTASGRDRRFTLRIFQAAQRGTTLCRSGRLLDFRPVLAPSPDLFGTVRSEIGPGGLSAMTAGHLDSFASKSVMRIPQ